MAASPPHSRGSVYCGVFFFLAFFILCFVSVLPETIAKKTGRGAGNCDLMPVRASGGHARVCPNGDHCELVTRTLRDPICRCRECSDIPPKSCYAACPTAPSGILNSNHRQQCGLSGGRCVNLIKSDCDKMEKEACWRLGRRIKNSDVCSWDFVEEKCRVDPDGMTTPEIQTKYFKDFVSLEQCYNADKLGPLSLDNVEYQRLFSMSPSPKSPSSPGSRSSGKDSKSSKSKKKSKSKKSEPSYMYEPLLSPSSSFSDIHTINFQSNPFIDDFEIEYLASGSFGDVFKFKFVDSTEESCAKIQRYFPAKLADAILPNGEPTNCFANIQEIRMMTKLRGEEGSAYIINYREMFPVKDELRGYFDQVVPEDTDESPSPSRIRDAYGGKPQAGSQLWGYTMTCYKSDLEQALSEMRDKALEDKLTDNDYKRLVGWLIQLLHALKPFETLRCIHGDIKPQNIFVENPGTGSESLILADLGGACCADYKEECMLVMSQHFRSKQAAGLETVGFLQKSQNEQDWFFIHEDLNAVGRMIKDALGGDPDLVRRYKDEDERSTVTRSVEKHSPPPTLDRRPTAHGIKHVNSDENSSLTQTQHLVFRYRSTATIGVSEPEEDEENVEYIDEYPDEVGELAASNAAPQWTTFILHTLVLHDWTRSEASEFVMKNAHLMGAVKNTYQPDRPLQTLLFGQQRLARVVWDKNLL